MNEVGWFKSLDRKYLEAPRIDVTANVMRAVGANQRGDAAVFTIAAGAAVLAGLAATALSISVRFATMQDPFASFAEAFRMVLQ